MVEPTELEGGSRGWIAKGSVSFLRLGDVSALLSRKKPPWARSPEGAFCSASADSKASRSQSPGSALVIASELTLEVGFWGALAGGLAGGLAFFGSEDSELLRSPAATVPGFQATWPARTTWIAFLHFGHGTVRPTSSG